MVFPSDSACPFSPDTPPYEIDEAAGKTCTDQTCTEPLTSPLWETLEVIKRDRFELVSAYLDGEVSPAERICVEEWLTSDLETQQLHRRLVSLRQAICSMGAETATPSSPLQQLWHPHGVVLPLQTLLLAVSGTGAVLLAGSSLWTTMPRLMGQPLWVQIGLRSNGLEISLDEPPIALPSAHADDSINASD